MQYCRISDVISNIFALNSLKSLKWHPVGPQVANATGFRPLSNIVNGN